MSVSVLRRSLGVCSSNVSGENNVRVSWRRNMAYNLKILNDSQQMEIVRKINATSIIKEVEKHPLLYDNKYPNHTQLTSEIKKKTWEIIAENLCGERWRNCTEAERESVAKEIQFKWKNLKDNFMRILKKEKEDEENGLNFKRKKYIYYDLLNFLRPYAPPIKSSRTPDIKEEVELGGKNASNIIYINETKDKLEEDILVHTSPPIAPKPIQIQTPIAQMPSFGTLQPVQLIQFQPNAVPHQVTKEEVEESANQKLAKVLEQLLHTQEEEKNDDPMGNKKFLLSLMPFMKKLPDDVNLEVRLQLMSVLQSYGVKDIF